MRFLSLSQAFKKTVKKAERQLINTQQGPELQEISPPIIALFRQGGATAREKQLALERFQFKGLSEREDPTRRISVYDTDEEARHSGWSPELKAEIEQMLLEGQNQYYFAVQADPTPKPWPSYDETEPSLILETARMVGIDLAHVLAYESENGNRPQIIKAITGEVAADEVEISA